MSHGFLRNASMTALWVLAGLSAVPAAGLAASPASTPNQVVVFPFPQPIRYNHHNDDYTVRVRVPGGEWKDLYEYNVKVDLDQPQNASMVYFNFDGSVEIAVQKNSGAFSKVAIRPDAKGIKSVIRDGIVYFTLTKPENLSVEFDGDHLHNLHIFTHAIRHDMPHPPQANLASEDITDGKEPDLNGPNVYFGPGIYKGSYRLQSNTTVYVDGSAILTKPFVIDNVENVKIISDGLFDNSDMMTVSNSRHVLIDGPIFINQPHGTLRCQMSSDIDERNIRTIGGGQWSDGLGHFACQNVTISDSFVRTSDDCLTFYNHRWQLWGDTRNIAVRNTTLWADVAHAIMIGIHGNTPGTDAGHPEAEVLENLRFTDIDILDHDEDDPEYEGAIGIMAGDSNTVRNVVFDRIRVERIEEGKLFNLHIAYTAKYNTSPGKRIDDITLRNIAFSGKGSASASRIYGYDADHAVGTVTLDNVTVGGRKILAPESGVLDVGKFVDKVAYR